MVLLLVVASGFDAALHHLSGSAKQSSFTIYNENGEVIVAYQGDLAACKAINKPAVVNPNYLHRG